MINFKEEIANNICKITNIEKQNILDYIEIPPDSNMGDYAFPCFRLAKELKKSPQIIASEIKEKINLNTNLINKIEIQGAYVNFFINKEELIKTVLMEFSEKKEKFGSANIGKGKNIVIDYSSPNIAKPFHIGHLRSTVIGGSLYKIYKFLGYNVIGVNHLGDYGTQFGKLIEGYKRWGKEYNIEENPIDELTKLYVRINNLCKEDEQVLEECRNNFKKLEEGDPHYTDIWEKFRRLSLEEFKKIYKLLNSEFDSWNGEAFYTDKMPEVIDILKKNNKLIESQGAKVVDLDKEKMPPCMIIKSNGSTTYATRDLAAILYRAREYDYEKAIYVTSYEQILHFKQVFEVAKYLNLNSKYTNSLIHVPFGMVFLKTGKMSTREGNIIKLEELLKESIIRVEKIIQNKIPNLKEKEEIAKKIGIGAVIFNDLYNSRIKDEIFDWDVILNFQGETGPYIQYIYVRTKSVLENAGYIPTIDQINVEKLLEKESIKIIKLIYEFKDKIVLAAEKNEPSIIARFLMDLSQEYSRFYNEHKIIVEDKSLQDARLYLSYIVGSTIKTGAELLGMDMPDRM